MPLYRADFDVKSGLVLPPKAAPVVLKTDTPPVELTISNAKPDKDGHVLGITVQVIGQADEQDGVSEVFREILARHLDVLSFATHTTYKIERCIRVLDWEPYQKERKFRALNVFDPDYPPFPEFDDKYARTVEAIMNARPDGFVARALECFRRGVIETQLTDQFQQFWFAIEVIAEGRKDDERIPIDCPVCREALYCEKCGKHPDRLPPGRQEIRKLIHMVEKSPESAKEVDRVLGNARNKLLHGSNVRAIEAEVKVSFEHIVNKAAWVAWHAIMMSMPAAIHEAELHFMHRDGQFARKQLVPTFIGFFQHDSATPQPTEDKIPTVEISMDAGFHPIQEQPGRSKT